MYRLLIPHIKPSVREIMIQSHWAPGLQGSAISPVMFITVMHVISQDKRKSRRAAGIVEKGNRE